MAPRLLTVSDLGALMRLKDSAGWNQTEQDWLRLFKFAPDGCFGIDGDGELTACTTALCYGTELAWIGMVLTSPDYRRRGLARALMEHALAYLSDREVRCIKLDATDAGRPLYESLGFRVESPIERWMRPPASFQGPVAEPSLEFDAGLDGEAFGADRSALIRQLAGEGHAVGRPGSKAAYFGPCVAKSPETAEAMLRWYLARHAHEPVYWDLLLDNAEAAGMAARYGFTRVRSLHRMVHGTGRLRCDDSKVYAIAGFELG